MTWLLLIYTVPSQPPGKRAAVWRDLKKCGAIYLRDGVAALPEHEDALAIFRQIATRIDGSGGQATIVEGARLETGREQAIVAQACAERAAEYAEILLETEGFIGHVEAERAHRELGASDVELMARDLDKLRRWAAQIQARDRFGGGEISAINELLERGARTLAALRAPAGPVAAGARP